MFLYVKMDFLKQTIKELTEIYNVELQKYNLLRHEHQEQLQQMKRQTWFNPELPPGSLFMEEVITPHLEKQLISLLFECSWSNELKRRVIHFGYKYQYNTHINNNNKHDSIPDWIPINEMEQLCGVPNGWFNQIIVNEYHPGQGITNHVDDPDLFEDIICTLSLGSSCVMELQPLGKSTRKEAKNLGVALVLTPRSLLKLSGESRYQWTHGIPRRQTDNLKNGQKKIHRGYRISITFRRLKNSL